MKSTSTQFTLIHLCATGKETVIALRKERSAYQLEDAVGETEANKSKKRTTFSSTEMFTDLDSVISYLVNVISALQCMFNCAHTQATSHPLLYNCIMTLFKFRQNAPFPQVHCSPLRSCSSALSNRWRTTLTSAPPRTE